MDWEDEWKWIATGAFPGMTMLAIAGRYAESGSLPTPQSVVYGAAATYAVGSGLGLATGGASTEVSAYMAIRPWINMNSTINTGRLVPGYGVYLLYFAAVYVTASWIAPRAGASQQRAFGSHTKTGESPFTGGLTGPLG